MRIVLLGPTGFVGRHVLAELLADNFFTAVSVLLRGEPGRLPFHPKLQLVTGALPVVPSELFSVAEPLVILHFATRVKGKKTEDFLLNSQTMKNILAEVDKHRQQVRGMIYGSSLSVLGSGEQIGVADDKVQGPLTLLAKSRAQCEFMIKDYARDQGLAYALMRPRFMIAPEDPETLGAWIKLVRAGIFLGTGEQCFRIIHVQDYAKIIVAVAKELFKRQQGFFSGSFGVGYEQPISFATIWETISESMGVSPTPKLRIPFRQRYLDFLEKIPSSTMQNYLNKISLLALSHVPEILMLQRLLDHNDQKYILSRNSRDVLKQTLLEFIGY